MVDLGLLSFTLNSSGSVRRVVNQPHHELASDSSNTSFETSSNFFSKSMENWGRHV